MFLEHDSYYSAQNKFYIFDVTVMLRIIQEQIIYIKIEKGGNAWNNFYKIISFQACFQ